MIIAYCIMGIAIIFAAALEAKKKYDEPVNPEDEKE